MSDNKKYYYLKLKENFFDDDAMIILESLPDGILYSNILLKLYLRSLKNEGKLMFKERIPYNPQMLSNIVRQPVGVVEKALQIFRDMGLIELLDNGVIYMMDMQNFIGESSTEADRKRLYRQKVQEEKMLIKGQKGGQMGGHLSGQSSDISPPEIEIELKKEIEIDKEIDTRSKEFDCSNKLLPILKTWNSLNLTKIISISGKREILVNTRVNQHGMDKVLKAIEMVNHSNFLKGQNNSSWQITFDWFIKPSNFLKVIEGNYGKGGKEVGKDGQANTRDYGENGITI